MDEEAQLQKPMKVAGWTVGRRLILGFAVMVLVIMSITGVGFVVTRTMSQSFDIAIEDILVEIKALNEIQVLSLKLLNTTRQYITFGEQSTLAEWKELTGKLDETLEVFAAVELGEGIIGQLQTALTNLKTESDYVIALYDAQMEDEELEVAIRGLEDEEQAVAAVLEDAVEAREREIEKIIAIVDETTVKARFFLAGFSIGAILLAIGITYLLYRSIVNPVMDLEKAAHRIAAGDLEHKVEVFGQDEIGILAHTFNQMTGRLRNLYDSLEDEVADRTRAFQKRSTQLEAAAQVAREAAAIRNIDQLLDDTVHLVSDQFGFYHTGIFLLDEVGEYAVLRSASSEGGQRMLAQGHRLKVGETGIVGHATSIGEPRVALDVGADAVFFDNPDLPDTRSEIAVPLIIHGEVVGALDVQSRMQGAFGGDDVEVLQVLADQVAVAISNAQLFQQARESLEAERRAYGDLSREAWDEMIRGISVPSYRYDKGRVISMIESTESREGRIETDGDLPELTLPIKVRGGTVATIEAHKFSDSGEWDQDEIRMLETLTEQLGVALESARLHQDTQRRAARERLTGEVTTRMRETLDVETVLQTAAREIGEALGLAALDVRLSAENEE